MNTRFSLGNMDETEPRDLTLFPEPVTHREPIATPKKTKISCFKKCFFIDCFSKKSEKIHFEKSL